MSKKTNMEIKALLSDGKEHGVRARGFSGDLDGAWRYASGFAGDKGFVASLPQIVHARNAAASSWEELEFRDQGQMAEYMSKELIWRNGFTPYSEEIVGKSQGGAEVFVELHGASIKLDYLDRFLGARQEILDFKAPQKQAYPRKKDAPAEPDPFFTFYASKVGDLNSLYKDALHSMLGSGRLPDGREVAVVPYEELDSLAELPSRFAIVIDKQQLTQGLSELYKVLPEEMGYRARWSELERLMEIPMFVARCGGPREAEGYIRAHKKLQVGPEEESPGLSGNFKDRSNYFKRLFNEEVAHGYLLFASIGKLREFNSKFNQGTVEPFSGLVGGANFLAVPGDEIEYVLAREGTPRFRKPLDKLLFELEIGFSASERYYADHPHHLMDPRRRYF